MQDTKTEKSRTLEKIYMIIGLLIMFGVFRSVISYSVWNAARIIFLTGVVILSIFHIKTTLKTLVKSPLVTILVIYASLSVFWSDDPPGTVSRAFAIIMLTIFSAYFAGHFTLREQLQMLGIVAMIYVTASVILIFILPEYGIQGDDWRGAFVVKNSLGRAMVIAALITLTYSSNDRRVNLLRVVGYIISVYCIFGSDSMTSLIVVVLITFLFFVYSTLRLGALPAAVLLIAGAVPIALFIIAIATFDTDAFLISIGRNPTLTGRTGVWDAVSYAIRERPWLGYGYGGFWNVSGGIYNELWSPLSNWQPSSSHNTYLDVWVNIGVFGFGLAVLNSTIVILQALLLVPRTRNLEGLWPILFLSFIHILGFSEDWILLNAEAWMLYAALSFTLSMPLKHSVGAEAIRRRAPQPAFSSLKAKA